MATRDPRRSGNPATRAAAPWGPAPSGTPSRFQAGSRAVLERLARLPRLTVPVVMLVLMLLGVSAPLAVALPALAAAGGFVLWLAILSWPVLNSQGRLVRGLMFGLIVGAALARIFGVL
jgi:hypothetical protein